MLIERIPEWLICEDVDGDRTFLFHTVEPRFVCEVFDENETGWDSSNIVFEMSDGRQIGGLVWYDEVNEDEEDIQALITHAAEALEIYEDNLENEYGDRDY